MTFSLSLTRVVGVAIFGLVVAVGLGLIANGSIADPIAQFTRLFFVVLCVFGLKFCSLREWLLFIVAVTLTFAAGHRPDAPARLSDALDLAAFFAAFIIALTLIKEAAARSRSVLKVGRYLTTRPPGRRYFAIAVGGHLMGVFLNFGAVSLLAPLIQNGTRDDGGQIDPDLERRQITGLIRGFSWILLWAPTTLSQAVLLTLFSGVNYSLLVGTGLGASAVFILLGRAVDKYEWRHLKQRPSPGGDLTLPKRSIAIVTLVCATLVAGTFGLMALTGFTVAQALLFVAPVTTAVWLLVQSRTATGKPEIVWRLSGIFAIQDAAAPGLARNAIALGLSGFIGRAAAMILPVSDLATQLNLAAMPGWLFLAMLPVLITLGGQVALSPILIVVFLGEVFQAIPNLPATPTQIVFALSAGWSLSMTASPNATATLLISSTCGIPPTKLTWKWNGHYALMCYAVLVVFFFLSSF